MNKKIRYGLYTCCGLLILCPLLADMPTDMPTMPTHDMSMMGTETSTGYDDQAMPMQPAEEITPSNDIAVAPAQEIPLPAQPEPVSLQPISLPTETPPPAASPDNTVSISVDIPKQELSPEGEKAQKLSWPDTIEISETYPALSMTSNKNIIDIFNQAKALRREAKNAIKSMEETYQSYMQDFNDSNGDIDRFAQTSMFIVGQIEKQLL